MDIKTDDTNSEIENNSAAGEEALENKDTSNNKEETKVDSKEEGSKEETKKEDPKKEDEGKEEPKTFENAAESTGGKFDTNTLIAASAKLEATIESLEANTPNEEEFYKNIDNLLSEDEKQLIFNDDKTEYFKAVSKHKEAFLSDSKVDTSKQKQELETIQGNLAISQAIDSVLKDPDYKDFNFVELQRFYTEDLSGKEQKALDEGTTKENLPDALKKMYNLYKTKNPINIKKSDNPDIPDTSNISKTSIEDKQEIVNKKEDEKYRNNVGFRKL
jgi:hypothetical protein